MDKSEKILIGIGAGTTISILFIIFLIKNIKPRKSGQNTKTRKSVDVNNLGKSVDPVEDTMSKAEIHKKIEERLKNDRRDAEIREVSRIASEQRERNAENVGQNRRRTLKRN